MTRIFVIHFQPLEYFPPALNFIRFIAGTKNTHVAVSTTYLENQLFKAELPRSIDIKVLRLSDRLKGTRLRRAVEYLRFIFSSVRQLLLTKPDVVVYFDPYSALPGLFYKLLMNRRVKLWIHFHEYFEPDWYSKGMLTARFAHFLEKKSGFERAMGISHTNPERVGLFLEDHPNVVPSKVFSFPNFPPESWSNSQNKHDGWNGPTKFVALGSFTLNGTYIGEFCNWIEKQGGKAELDIYSLYFDDETRNFLEQKNRRLIRFHKEGIPYDQVPELFNNSGFHIGLVLYRCEKLNMIHNAPNKLFEYLACGLDVWYPPEMTGTASYATYGTFPKVLPIDFQNLDAIDLQSTQSREDHRYVRTNYNYETVYSDWAAKLLESN